MWLADYFAYLPACLTHSPPLAIRFAQGKAVPKQTFQKDYQMQRKLGKGNYSEVRLAVHRQTRQKYAVKVVTKSTLQQEDLDALYVEVEVLLKVHKNTHLLAALRVHMHNVVNADTIPLLPSSSSSSQLEHPNVVNLIAFYEDDTKFYLVMELMTGGELFQRIVQKSKYTESEARDLVRTLTMAVNYCHEQGVMHRDLKVRQASTATTLHCRQAHSPHLPSCTTTRSLRMCCWHPRTRMLMSSLQTLGLPKSFTTSQSTPSRHPVARQGTKTTQPTHTMHTQPTPSLPAPPTTHLRLVLFCFLLQVCGARDH